MSAAETPAEVEASSAGAECDSVPASASSQRGSPPEKRRGTPPLGLAYVAAALEAAGHEVLVIDALGEAPLARGPSVHPRLATWGLSAPEILARVPAHT